MSPDSIVDRTPRAGGLRTIRFVLVAVAVGVIINSVAIVVLLHFNSERITQIQRSRVDTILASCRDQNERHDFAVIVTNRLIARPAVPPARRFTPQQRRAQNAAIQTWVNALVPRRDCERLVGRSVPNS